MASFFVKRGYLYIDSRYRGVRCQEATKKRDTTEARADVRRDARRLQVALDDDTFQYATWFPTSKRAALFVDVNAGPPLYADYARTWLTDRAARTAPGTRYDETRMLEARIIPSLGHLHVDQITEEHAERLIATLKRGDGPASTSAEDTPRRKRPRLPVKLSNRRANMILKLLRLSLDRAVRRGWLEDNPARVVGLLREEKPRIDPLDAAEMRAVLEGGGLEAEDERYFRVAFLTGLRPGEQIGLEWETDIDLVRQLLHVRQTVGRFGAGPTKTVNSARDVTMLPTVQQIIQKQRGAKLKGRTSFRTRSAELGA